MSSIANAMKMMGWVHPNARVSCSNCGSVRVDVGDRFVSGSGGKVVSYHCIPGGFITPRYAVCDKHTPMPLIGGTQP